MLVACVVNWLHASLLYDGADSAGLPREKGVQPATIKQ